MKKWTTLWMMVMMLGFTLPASAAMSISKMRQNARFLTDRMAYELRLNEMQYNDVYEVNYDFINNVRYLMDDVVRGHGYAVDRYYEFLNYRNDDLRWILSGSQYRRFMDVDYFFRPIYTTSTNWLFRIYQTYRDVNHFYFHKPPHYKSYKGGHFRSHFGNVSYYKNHRKDQYRHDFYQGKIDARPHKPAVTKPTAKKDAPRKEVRPAKQPAKKEVDRNDNVRPNRSDKKTKVDSSKPKVNVKKENQDNRRQERNSRSSNSRSTKDDAGRKAVRSR